MWSKKEKPIGLIDENWAETIWSKKDKPIRVLTNYIMIKEKQVNSWNTWLKLRVPWRSQKLSLSKKSL